MQYSAVSRTAERNPRRTIGALAIFVGAILTAVGISAGPAAGEEPPPTQTVLLNNVDAPTENTNECPNAIDDFWHFVISGSGYAFTSITLNLDGKSFTFTGTAIIPNPNNQKLDNVYVMVPDGYDFDDLIKLGSSAQITPATGSPMFVLSHFCDGPGRPTTTTTSTTTSSTTTTQPTTTSTTTTTTTTTTTSTTTSTSTSTSTSTTTTTLPCEWDESLEPGDPNCVPDLSVSAICYDLDNSGEIERYWHRLTNGEAEPIDVTWSDGAATLPANGSEIVSSADQVITLLVGGKEAATTPAPSEEFCQQTVTFEKIVTGPEREDGEAAPVYTIQVSRLVGAEYLPEGEPFELVGGEKITVPLPSTLNPEGINYQVEEIDAGGAHATSVTPDTFFLTGHKNETISVVIENTFAAISIEKTASASTVTPGQELNYTLVATNTGELTLGPVTIYDRLPAEVSYADYAIVGGAAAGECFLDEATPPQLVRCELADAIDTGEETPAITLLVTVDPGLTASNPILNQAMAIGNYADALTEAGDIAEFHGGRLVEALSTDLTCNPAPDEVCDLSAKIGVGVDTSTTTSVAQEGPTTTAASGAGGTTSVVAELPRTGSSSPSTLIVIGGLLVLFGMVILVTSRRPVTT